MTVPGPLDQRRSPFHFDWTLNLGHLLTIATLIVGGIAAWTTLAIRISSIDTRTADYAVTRDLTRSNTQQIEALRGLISENAAVNRQILDTLANVRSDVAAVGAQVRIILDAQQRTTRP